MKKNFAIICLLLMVLSSNAQTQNRKPATAKPRTTTATKPRTTTTAPKSNAAKATPKKKSVAGLCPDDNHPHAIDLGLPTGTRWACCNVGASIPEECGGYFAEGEVKAKKYFWVENYKFNDGSAANGSIDYGWYTTGHYDVRRTEYDAAKAVMGGKWYMPSLSLYEELLNNCTAEWKEFDGLAGIILTGPNGSSIFFPAAGYYWKSELSLYNEIGYYRPGTVHNNCNISRGYYTEIQLGKNSQRVDLYNSQKRHLGVTVRAVLDEQ